MKHSKSYMQKKRLGKANFLLLEEVKKFISEECDNSEEFFDKNGFIKLNGETSLKINDIELHENRELFRILKEWLKEWGWYLELYQFNHYILIPINYSI